MRLPSIILLCLTLFLSCKQSTKETDLLTTIPELLTRNEKLQNGKEWDNVMNQYQKLKLEIGKNNKDHKSRIQLANLFIREARVTGEHGHYYTAALTMTDQVLSDKSKDNVDMTFMALVTKAGVQLSHHYFEEALETGNKAIMINPNNPQIYGVLVDANVELGNYTEAVKMADIMIKMKPDLRSYARISYIREIHGQVNESFAAMKMAVEAGIPGYEDTAWAMLTLADLYYLYGLEDKAKALYNEILAQRPDYPFAIAALGKMALDKKDFINAEKYTKEAIDIIPEVGFYTQLAEIFKNQGQSKEMKSLIDEIFVMLADDEKTGHNMNLEYADVYLNLLNDTNKALNYTQKEYKKRPKNIDVNRMLAKIYAAAENKEMLEKSYAVATATNSKHPDLNDLKISKI